MESRYSYYATTRSNEELEERVNNRQDYMPETVEASITELQHRGREFSEEELQVINEDLQAHRQNAGIVSSRVGMFSKEYKNVIVTDPDAPLLYSRLALYLFTVFMSALFGSIMMAMNISKTEKRSKAIWAILFGIGFTTFQILIISNMKNPSSSFAIIFGLIASYCLDYFFWRPFIGYASFYRARPIWVPLIITIFIVALFVWAIIYNGQQQ